MLTEIEREAKFQKAAEKRTNAVLNKLKTLGNLSNKRLYKYDEKEIDKIFKAINTKVKTVKAMFYDYRKKEFKL